MNARTYALCAALALSAAACGGDDDEACTVEDQKGCEDGLVCETVEGAEEPQCLDPVELHGSVFDLQTDEGIEGARVVALDVNGAAASSVAITDESGDYELWIPSTRMEDGTPIGVELTLRVDADGYQTFPAGVRPSLPVDTGTAVSEDNAYVVSSALTQVGLIALAGDAGVGRIVGDVEIPESRVGVLVVAESGDLGYTAIADADGDYAILNLPDGSYEVKAYALGHNYEIANADIAGDEVTVDLAIANDNAGIVEGSISIVETEGASSVVLAVESTFNENLLRGQTVPGLRAPPPPTPGNITSGYTIEGVPAGRYVVLGAFENDGLVRDPDEGIGGTALLRIAVSEGGTTTVDGFKINEALIITSPGGDGASATSATPTFQWEDDSSEKAYQLTVFDAFGEIVWDVELPESTGEDPSHEYAGETALEVGMYYQFRVVSKNNGGTPIARSEDLKGIFYVE